MDVHSNRLIERIDRLEETIDEVEKQRKIVVKEPKEDDDIRKLYRFYRYSVLDPKPEVEGNSSTQDLVID